jgi:hypothetical protein
MTLRELWREQKWMIIPVLAAWLLALTGPLWAANCAAIQDADQRAYCRALEQRNAARCVEIQDFALRQQCRAELGGGQANCSTISDPGEREMCRARARP